MGFRTVQIPALWALRAIQGCLAATVFGLSAYIVYWFNVDTMTLAPWELKFLLFTSVWSTLSTVYIDVVARMAPRVSHPYATLGVVFLNVVLWFAGFVALATFLSRQSFCLGMVCDSARADTVLAAFSFVAWAVTEGLLVKDVFMQGPRSPSPIMMKEALIA